MNIEELYEAYYDCRKHKRGSASALEYELNLEANLHALYGRMISGTYSPGQSTAFVIRRPKAREVFAAQFEDRIVHHWLIRKIEPWFEKNVFDPDAYSCRTGKGTAYGIKRLHEKLKAAPLDAWIAKFDICAFFMSIDRNVLDNMMRGYLNMIPDLTDRELTMQICSAIALNDPSKNCIMRSHISAWNCLTPERSMIIGDSTYGIPIGNLTSQFYANVYLSGLDALLEKLFPGMHGRYVDDFYAIGTREDLKKAVIPIKEILAPLHMRIHDDKLYVQPVSHGVHFIGAFIRPDRINADNKTVSNAYECVMRLNKNRNPSRKALIRGLASINSYLGHLGKFFRSYSIRKNMWGMLSPIWKERIYGCNSLLKCRIKKRFRA